MASNGPPSPSGTAWPWTRELSNLIVNICVYFKENSMVKSMTFLVKLNDQSLNICVFNPCHVRLYGVLHICP